MSDNKPLKFRIKIDFQCASCGALIHQPEGRPMPKFCPRCGSAMERFCLKCHKKAEMYFEEWWPEDDECVRTYGPPKRCSGCGAILESGSETDREDDDE